MFWKKKTGTEQRGKVKCGFNLTISSHVYNTSPQNSLLETFLLTPHSKYTSILYKYRLQWAMLPSPPPSSSLLSQGPLCAFPCPCIDSTLALWVAIKKSSCVCDTLWKAFRILSLRVIWRRGLKERKWLHDWRTVWFNQLQLHYTRLFWASRLFHVKMSELLK